MPDLFLILRAFDPQGSELTFQGALDPNTPIANGWLRASHRRLDPKRSKPYQPWHPHDRLSIRQIALRLTESPHPSATGLSRWGTSTVGRMLRNEAYAGTMYLNRQESLEGDPKTAGRWRRFKSRTRRRPVAEWIPLRVPPLISEELFRRSQALHPENARFSPRHLKSGHSLLRGLVRCRVCDLSSSCHRMRGRNGTFHHYSYCPAHDVLRLRGRIGRCPQRNIRADELDSLVWAEVHRHLDSPALILDAYTRLRAEPLPRPGDLVAQQTRELDKKLADTDREEHRLLDAYQARLIELDQLERRQALLRQKRAHVQARPGRAACGARHRRPAG